MKNIDKMLKNDIERKMQRIEVPETLYSFANEIPTIAKETQTKLVSTVKPNQYKWKTKVLKWGTTAAVASIMVGGSLFSTALADFVERIPFLNIVQTEDFTANFGTLVDKAEQNQFSFIGESEKDNGVKMVVTDAMYDGETIALSFSVETMDGLRTDDHQESYQKIKFDGQDLDWGTKQDFSKVGENKYAGIMEIYLPKEKMNQDKINLDLAFNMIIGVKGKWNYNFDVLKADKK